MAADDRAATPAVITQLEDLTAQQPANDAAGALALDTLLVALRERPHSFDLYQALRRIEHAYRQWPRVGTAARPSEEPVRFGQAVSLTAAPSTLSHFEPSDGARPARLYNYFLGVLGPNGPLPLHLTEYAKQRAHLSNDRSLVAFLDMFHHRFLSLFYRAHSSADPVTQHDRPESDRFAEYVASMLGLGLDSLRSRDALPDNVKLYYAGLLASQAKNAEGLRAMLEDYLQINTRVEEFVGEWVSLPSAQGWKLGLGAQRASPLMGQLASTALVGTRVWLRQHRFRIALGPLRYDQFQKLLPGTPLYLELTALVRNYIGDELKWDLRLTVADDVIQPARISALQPQAQLGRTSWLVVNKRKAHWEDLVIDPTQDYGKKVGQSPKSPLSSPPARKA